MIYIVLSAVLWLNSPVYRPQIIINYRLELSGGLVKRSAEY
jgi:hypothetical protein